MVRVIIDNQEYSFEFGTPFRDIARKFEPYHGMDILLVKADDKICELHKCLNHERKLEFLTLADVTGQLTYERSAIFIMLKAIHDEFPEVSLSDIRVDFKIKHGIFIQTKNLPPSEGICSKIRNRMKEIIEEKIPIYKMNVTLDEALYTFHVLKMIDKEKLFRYRRTSHVNLYEIDDFTDYFYGFMVHNTSYIKLFDLRPYDRGIMLLIPSMNHPDQIPNLEVPEKVFRELMHTNDWADAQNLGTVAALNDRISHDQFNNIVLIQEAHMEHQIAELAARIVNKGGVKIILIGGPSSSGKTTFSKKLSIQLQAQGVNPQTIECDNYFVDREKTPKDEKGNYDFECLEALDLELLGKDIYSLISGERVEMPVYNFRTGHREYNGKYLQMDENSVLVMEGIHCLNPKMLESIDDSCLFRIFINALTPLNIDDHNYIHATDTRLIRRIIRDNRTRGYNATQTIRGWQSVRDGEEKYIMPFQNNADAVFISSLVYEFSVLKPYAEALLFSVDPDCPEYLEAKRLLKMLDYFLAIPSESVPATSIVREFIGGLAFDNL